ncbi:MAG TPA: DsbA family protein [Acetobacteraceae bacterium]|nr:DsbA family protein [Acetobacteraceae bacterium]
MPVSRRTLLALSGGLAGALATPAWAQDATLTNASPTNVSPTGERAIGDPKAPVSVMEFFSLTCTHCAAFARETFPDVRKKLIDTGKLHYIFRDFPLDRVALLGEMVARTLPPDRYEPFLLAMFQTQDRWAFAQGVNSTEEIGKMAALAGLSHAAFEKVIHDDKLRAWVLAEQAAAEKKYNVNSTPTFVFNGPKAKNLVRPGEMPYADFEKLVVQAAG